MDYVSRDTARVVAIGVVSIVAIAMGAATIQTTVDFGTGTASGGLEIGQSGGQAGGLNDSTSETNGSIDMGEGGGSDGFIAQTSTCVEPLSKWYGGLGYFGFFGLVLYGIKRRYSLGASFLGMYAIAPVALTAYFLTTDCTAALDGQNGQSGVVEGIGDAAGQGVVSTDVSPMVVGGVFAVALVATAVVLYRASSDQTVAMVEEDDEEELGKPDVGDLAAAAAAAADRLEERNADVDNEVYAAWRDMTALLRVSRPESSTPGEFAEAAVEAGLDEDDVGQLTQLFEEVRYGKRDPESREERAIEVFRSIEAAYGTGDDAGADEGGER
ncbi:DUF4129 domain-containing protein [Halobacteria archaeon HArc-gm2]|nr:DUF4129 domain-containing protein [Halobacteria archaeon HArc-gm2]